MGKKITHMWRRWGTPQTFFLVFTDELEKQIFTKKLLKWANKKQNNFNIYKCYILKKIKIKKNTWRYYFTPVYQESQWYHLQFLRYRAWQSEIGNFRSFFAVLPPKNQKNLNFEKVKKNCWRNHFMHVYQKSHHIMYRSWDIEWDRQNF